MTVEDGATISAGNDNAISLGDNADITVQGGGTVTNAATGQGGGFGTGFNTIEFNSHGTALIEEAGAVIQTGTSGNAETSAPSSASAARAA